MHRPAGQIDLDTDAVLCPPRLIIGVSLVLWGAVVGQAVLGLLCAVLAEARHWTRLRWDFDPPAALRAWRASVALMLLGGLMIWLDGLDARGVYRFFRWWPVMLMPVLLVQQFGRSGQLPASTFSFFARRRIERALAQGRRVRMLMIHFGFPFIGICWLSAALGMEADKPWFFPGALGFLAVCLWAARQRGERRLPAWLLASVLTGLLAFVFQWGLLGLRDWSMNRQTGGRAGGTGLGPNHITTQIGNLGELKQSREILWRLRPVSGAAPTLLRMASYNSYFRGFWRYGFRPAQTSWEDDFRDMPVFGANGMIEGRVARREDVVRPRIEGLPEFNLRGPVKYHSLLPLPDGTRTLFGIRAVELECNSLGSVRIAPDLPVADARVLWGEPRNLEARPWDADLMVPANERAVVEQVAATLKLGEGTTAERVGKLRDWFLREFSYSRYLSIHQPQESIGTGPSALGTFLTEEKSGHCEFFATATTLLMRQAGVPARYAVGFSVSEQDPDRHEWVVRGTHAHAWARVWFAEEGLWKDVDLTPPQWLARDQGKADAQQELWDAWQRFREDLLIWRTNPDNFTRVFAGLGGVGVLMLGWLARRLVISRQPLTSAGQTRRPRTTGALAAIEPIATKRLGPRPANRPLASWLAALTHHYPELAAPLGEALALHQRSRFDPLGLDATQAARLTTLTATIRARIRRRPQSP